VLKEIFAMVLFDARTELRRRYAFGGILLYVVAAVYVSYLCFLRVLEPETWNALFWIIILFAAINGTAKSFLSETKGKMLYYYFMVRPGVFILGRTFYNTLLLGFMGLLCLGIFMLLNGDPVSNFPLFLCSLLLGVIGLAAVFTLVSAIASKAGQNLTLMSILSFPIVLPLLMILIRLTNFSMSGMSFSDSLNYLLSLLSLDILMFVLSVILFPYLWKE